MAHDVFISYASQNKSWADAVCEALEAAGIPCWIAPRDVPAGAAWPPAITAAVKGCRVMVLVFTREADASTHVLNEVISATDERKTIIPFRLDNTKPELNLALHLKSVQWIDGFPAPMQRRLEILVGATARALGKEQNAQGPPPPVGKPAQLVDAAPALALSGASYEAAAPRTGQGTQPGTVKVNPVDGQRYVWIPPGEFEMGASPGDPDALENEKPRHSVMISKGFWIGETPVTVEAYLRFAKATRRGMPTKHALERREWKLARVPMTCVTWHDAVAYVEWVAMRLPTEAEWEYAARAGTTGPRYGHLERIAWTRGNSGDCVREVRAKDPNPFGLYDMIGNIWEWTADWYDANYYASSPVRDPQGAASGQYRSARGSPWYVGPSLARTSCRGRFDPASRYYVGFRCAGETIPCPRDVRPLHESS